ncbi:MAG: hypothetical protein ABEK01_03380 [Candidatus Nanohaloarchaea archaeon]
MAKWVPFVGEDGVNLQDLDESELKEERTKLKADIELKRDKHEGLAEDRRAKFERLKEVDDDLMKEELAQEIATIEDEMAIYHNEHAKLMDALRVLDGLIAVKRKQHLMEDRGIVNKIEDMDQEELTDKLKRQDVQEMIRQEKWDDLEDLFRGDLRAGHSGNKRVQEIIDQVEEEDENSIEAVIEQRDKRHATPRGKEKAEGRLQEEE